MRDEERLPAITIITPCLNASATIDRALNSVREQQYSGRVEHIVVDGGSTDGTVERLRQRDDVRWTSEPDRGLSHAMNKGVAAVRGGIIGWLNADDWYEPGALHAVGCAFALNPDAVWVTGYCRIVDADGDEIRKAITAYKNFLLRHYSLSLYLTQNFISAPATFLRREAIGDEPYDERFRTSMDYDLQLRLARRSDPVILRQYLAAFRMAEGTLSMSSFERQFEEHYENARSHGDGHRLAVLGNRGMSRAIVWSYRLFRAVRGRSGQRREAT